MKNKIGEKRLTNEGYTIEIIECFGRGNCTIKFESGFIIKNIWYSNIKNGEIKNPYHKSVYGVGFTGVGKYSKATHLKAYHTWHGMLQRCNDLKYQEKQPTYKECYIFEEWHNFQNFGEWFENNYKEGFALDKDILLKGNKTYSPTTCTFVPQEINSLLTKRDSKRGKYPIGVSKLGNKLQAKISLNGKTVYLGLFNTPEEAFKVYKVAKEAQIKELAEKYKKEITEPIYQALINYKVEITD